MFAPFGFPNTGNTSNQNNGTNPRPLSPSAGTTGGDFWSILTQTAGAFANGFGRQLGDRVYGQNTPPVFAGGYGTQNSQPTFNGNPGPNNTANNPPKDNTAMWVVGGIVVSLAAIVGVVVLVK